MSFQGAGICTIVCEQSGNSAYNAAPQRSLSFSVGRGVQSLTWTSAIPSGAFVNGPTFPVSATSSVGLTPVFSIRGVSAGICTVASGVLSFQGAGTCIVDADQPGNTNYNASATLTRSFSVGRGSQTIIFQSIAPTNAQVNGANYSFSATSSASLPVVLSTVTPLVCALNGGIVSFRAAGTCKKRKKLLVKQVDFEFV